MIIKLFTFITETRVTVLDTASWPSAKDLELDESQFNALQLALTKEFAVIQGPPGTGKTYIGLKVLSNNKNDDYDQPTTDYWIDLRYFAKTEFRNCFRCCFPQLIFYIF